MSQSNPIYIDSFQKGVASSPYIGFGKMVGLDIYRKPGAIISGIRLDKNFDTTGIPMASCIAGSTGEVFIGTSGSRLYKNGVYLTNTSAPVHDIVYLHDYIIISTSSSSVDVYGPVSNAPVYYSSKWTTLNVSNTGYKKMCVGIDDSVWIGNEGKLANIYGTTGAFATWGLNPASMTISENRVITTLCMYNRYIAMMTTTPNSSQNSRFYFADLFQANNTTKTFNLTQGTDIPERRIDMLINSNNRLYFFGNDTGTIYSTNMVSYQDVCMLPNRLPLQTYSTFPCGVAQVGNEILWGIGGDFNTAFDTVYGVYSLRGSAILTKNIVSGGAYGQVTKVNIPTILSLTAGQYQVGWTDGTNTTIDTANFNPNTGYNAYFESVFLETGTAIKPRTFQTIQLNFGTNLSIGQQVRIKYRTASNGAWQSTLNNVFSYTQWGAVNSAHGLFPVTNTTNLQIRCEFDLGTSTPYGANIELQSIILI